MEPDSNLTFFASAVRSVKESLDHFGAFEERCYQIADHTICLHFASPSLVTRIAPAFEHLTLRSVQRPAFNIYLWDYASTHHRFPKPSWMVKDKNSHGDIWIVNDPKMNVVYEAEFNILSVLDKINDVGFYFVEGAAQIPYIESASPIRKMLSIWMGQNKRFMVHAAAVGKAEGGVLVVGKGGSGKSTTALACLNSELNFVGDDYCLLSNDSIPSVHSIYSTGKLSIEDIDRFPNLKPALNLEDRPSEEKAVFFLQRCTPKKISQGFPIRAILLPFVTTSRDTMIRRTHSSKGYLALAPSLVFLVKNAEREALQFFSEAARQLPVFELELGTNLSGISERILELLNTLNK